jgi:hypothetical protein
LFSFWFSEIEQLTFSLKDSKVCVHQNITITLVTDILKEPHENTLQYEDFILEERFLSWEEGKKILDKTENIAIGFKNVS